MALKSTIYKAALQLADMDRSLYADHALTLALHPSENEERLMLRLLAFALCVPADDRDGTLVSTAGLSDTEAPDLWHKDHTGAVRLWVEVGQPDDRRIAKACARAERVSVWAFASSTPLWWAGIQGKVARWSQLDVWQVPADASRELATLAARNMRLQVTVQDSAVWVGDGQRSVCIEPLALQSARRPG